MTGPLPGAGGSADRLLDRIKALGNANGVLHLGSHPDDEEGGMIAFASRRHAARTVYWSATRGEGGQNRRGPERAEALGMVRTWESLEARSIDGGGVLYGPFYDFGFSKSGEDTLSRWGREAVVREVVRAIRMVQPLVVVSRWSGTENDGHGHHQAIGLVAREAYDAAADPGRFADLGLPAWRAQKLYRSVAGDWQPGEAGSFGVVVDEHEQAGHLRIDTGVVDPVAGLTYQEQAHLAINRHRSQGIGFVPEPGPYYFYYRLEHAHRHAEGREQGFFDGLDPALTALADYPGRGWAQLRGQLAAVVDAVGRAAAAHRPDRPSGAVPHLLEALDGLCSIERDLPSGGLADESGRALAAYLRRRIAEVEAAVAICLHLRVECLAEQPRLTPGQAVGLDVRVWNGGDTPVSVQAVELELPPGWEARRDEDRSNDVSPTAEAAHTTHHRLSVPDQALARSPYWLRAERNPYRYPWPDDAPAGAAIDEPLVTAAVRVQVDGRVLGLQAPAVHRDGFVGGSRDLPITVLPPLALVPRQRREIVPVGDLDATLELDVTVRCIEAGGAPARLSVQAPQSWTVTPSTVELNFERGGETRNARFRVVVPGGTGPGDHQLVYQLDSRGRACGVELNPIRLGLQGASGPPDEHDCVAEAHVVRPAAVAVHLIDARFVRTLRYGYVRGLDEQVVPSLVRFELDLTELDDEQLAFGDLAGFAAIVVGPNAYNARPAVRRHAGRLLDYAREGGTLIVQYQTYGYDDPGLLPWPARFNQPHDRVTDATAGVEVLEPAHPVLHVPNTIGPADFDGWVHDRGMYFLGSWDRRYVPVLASHDEGEPPAAGGLLTASVGRGTYVYVAYSLFRQIPVGVAGAVRLFANLLGLAEVRVRERMARLAAVDLFSSMAQDELYEAARIVSERWVDEGTLLAREGERGHEMFILVDGRIAVTKTVSGGPERLLREVGPGASLGELTLLADIPRSASLRAVTDAVVLVIRDDAFEGWLRQHPDLSRGMLARLAEMIVEKDERP